MIEWMMMKFFFHFLFSALLVAWCDAKPWSGADVSRSRSYINALHRNRRNHHHDDKANSLKDKIFKGKIFKDDYDYDEYDEEDRINMILKEPSKKEAIESIVDKFLELVDTEKLVDTENSAEYINPFEAEQFSIKSAPLHRNAAKQESVKLVASKLHRVRALEERLRHIEDMKRSLSKKIRKLQQLKERESNTKMRIENEVVAAEREWKYAIDRLPPES